MASVRDTPKSRSTPWISSYEIPVSEPWRRRAGPIGQRTNFGYSSKNQPRLLVLAFPSRVWSPILNYASSPRVRQRIDRERAAELTILGWVVSPSEVQETAGNMFLVENPVGATSWNQPSFQRLRKAPFVFEDLSHFCMFGVQDPRSRRALKRPVTYLTNRREQLRFVVRKCPNEHVHGTVKRLTNAYRSSSRWHTRAWVHAVIRGVESDQNTREISVLSFPKTRSRSTICN